MSDLRPEQLTEKEIEIIRLVADGLTNKEIGQKLHIGRSAIGHYYLAKLYRKLGYRPYAVKCRLDMIRWAIRNGIIAAGLLLCVSVSTLSAAVTRLQ